jgi:hypothetical protein
MGRNHADSSILTDSPSGFINWNTSVKSVTSWAKLIMLSCHDEKAGFDKFFGLLDEFVKHTQRQAA